MKLRLNFLFILFFQTYIFSQISGIVFDEISKKPIENVNVIFNKNGAVTNQKGEFVIDAQVGDKLIFSHIGYEQTFKIAKDEMSLYLKKSFVQWNEIIVRSGFNEELYSHSAKSLFESNSLTAL